MNYTWLHVESTTRCNAWCPSCPRNNRGFGLAEDLKLLDLDPFRLDFILKKFPIDTIQFCGNYGDPCAAKNLKQQLDVAKNNNIKKLQIHTNGGLRRTSWWSGLAAYLNENFVEHEIWFTIDGIGETHEYYRQGTKYDRVIENATAFIQAGGTAMWQFVPFAHNEHQIKDCLRLSKQLGFASFKFIKGARYKDTAYHYKTGESLDIKPPSQNKEIPTNHKLFDNKEKTLEIQDCMHLEIPSIFLSAKGLLTPCCHLRDLPLTDVDIYSSITNKNFRQDCLQYCGVKQ